MESALEDAGLSIDQIDYINAQGTGTKANDTVEIMAIKHVFGDLAPHKFNKSVTGHSLGAAGAIETIACIKTINDGIVHPTIKLQTFDPACDLDYVPNKSRSIEVRRTLSNSFGLGE